MALRPLALMVTAGSALMLAGKVANIIAAPLTADFTRAVYLALSTKAVEIPPHMPWPVKAMVSIGNELKRLATGLLRMATLCCLIVIPDLGSSLPVAILLIGAWTVALHYLDYPMPLFQLDYRRQQAVIRHHRR